MFIKTKEELETLREAGRILRETLDELEAMVKPGVSTEELNDKALELMRHYKVKPSFLNYKPSGHFRAYPAAICASVNEEVVHGIPNENPRVLSEGDIVTLDSGLWLDGICTDSARTVIVGDADEEIKRLVSVGYQTLDTPTNTPKPGAKIS